MPISRSSDFTNDFPPLTAAEAKSFTFSVAAMAGANVRVTLPSWIIADCREGCHRPGRENRLLEASAIAEPPTVRLLLFNFGKDWPWRTMDSAKYVPSLWSPELHYSKDAGSFESPLHAWEICSKAGTDICAILTCWLALDLTLVLK